MADPSRASASERGRLAENLALQYLEEQGLVLLERNFRCRSGELDLIMQDGGFRVAVEVRYRAGQQHGGALYSVDARKQRRLLATSLYYLKVRKFHGPFRLDVVAMSPAKPDGLTFNWIKNAITAS